MTRPQEMAWTPVRSLHAGRAPPRGGRAGPAGRAPVLGRASKPRVRVAVPSVLLTNSPASQAWAIWPNPGGRNSSYIVALPGSRMLQCNKTEQLTVEIQKTGVQPESSVGRMDEDKLRKNKQKTELCTQFCS